LIRLIKAASPRTRVLIKFYRGATEQTVEVLMGHDSPEDQSSKDRE